MEEASTRLGVRRSTLDKLLNERVVSPQVRRKIESMLKEPARTVQSVAKPASMVDRLRRVHELYRNLGTLEAAGKELGVTRERVRQLLVRGAQLGLFKYKPFELPYLPMDKLITDYVTCQSIGRVASLNSISTGYLKKLMTAYGITGEILESYRHETRRGRCLDQYNLIAERIGHHPTTTELHATAAGRRLHTRIRREWGSIDAFREHLNIPKPPQGSPSGAFLNLRPLAR